MKAYVRWSLLAGLSLCLGAGQIFGQTNKSGNITASQTWSGTINVIGDVIISGGTVTVSPGTIVKFATTNNNPTGGHGDATHNYIVVKGSGGMTAVGTAASRILFTTAAATPQKNLWGRIAFESLVNDTVTSGFKYCDFEYGHTAIDFRNTSGTEISKVNFDHCNFRHMSGTGVYLTTGGASTITNCTFFDLSGTAIFSHAASTLNIRYCTIDSCCSAINCATISQPFQTITVDHVTMYRTDLRMQGGNFQPWNGDAVSTVTSSSSDQGGKITVTNSIAQYSTKYGFEISTSKWTTAHDYNCWFDSWTTSVSSGTVGTHSLDDVDPLLADPVHHDFRLKTGSPCIGKASDGTNMGCSQVVVTTGISNMTSRTIPFIAGTASPNPFTDKTTITIQTAKATLTIYNMHGQMIKRFINIPDNIVWDRTDHRGKQVDAGLYVFQVSRDNQCYRGTVMVTAR